MTLTQYTRSLARRCSVLGVEPPRANMVQVYYAHGYSPRDAASIELDEYIQFKKQLKQEARDAEKAGL